MISKKYKIAIFGDQCVGKSAIVKQFVINVFTNIYDPTIEDSYHTKIIVDDMYCDVDLLDTAGSEQFAALRDLYIRDNDGFILVYSIDSKASFEKISEFLDAISNVKNTDKKLVNIEGHKIPCVVVGNKIDLKRNVSTEIVHKLIKKYEIKYIETSAKTYQEIKEIFIIIIRQINNYYKYQQILEKKKNKKCIIL